MKTTNFKLSIDNPCEEKWSDMQPSENGRYCGSCDKIVVDFSKMSDAEIIGYFTNYKGAKVCGHIRKSQLERAFPKKPLLPVRSPWRTALAGVALLALLAQPSAQAASWSVSPVELRSELGKENDDAQNKLGYNISGIKGLVRSSLDQSPIANATVSVVVNGKVRKQVNTDAKGNFELDVDSKTWAKGFSLVIAAEGYDSQVLAHSNLSNQLNVIDLNLFDDIMIEGGLGYIEF